MTDAAPKRIWACPMRDGGGFGPGDEDDPPIWAEGYWDQVQDGSKDENEYILASEHAALIREAEAERDESRAYALALEQELRDRTGRELLQAAEIAEADAKQLTEEALQWRADNMPFAAQFAEEQAKAGPRIAAAIRAAKATP